MKKKKKKSASAKKKEKKHQTINSFQRHTQLYCIDCRVPCSRALPAPMFLSASIAHNEFEAFKCVWKFTAFFFICSMSIKVIRHCERSLISRPDVSHSILDFVPYMHTFSHLIGSASSLFDSLDEHIINHQTIERFRWAFRKFKMPGGTIYIQT